MGFLSSKNDFHASPYSIFSGPGATTADYNEPISEAMGGYDFQNIAERGSARAGEDQFIKSLQAQAAGQGPSLAQLQLQQALQQGQKTAAGQVASTRGMNPALQARLILQNQAGQAQEAAGQSAALRMQEQLNAQGQLGNALANQRAQDIGQYGAASQRTGVLGGLQNQQLGIQSGNWNQAQGINAQVAEQNSQSQNALTGGLLGGIASGGMGLLGGAAKAAAPATSMFAAGAAPKYVANQGGKVPDMEEGGNVPGKPKVSGDHPSNDTVPAMLSPGEIVIPRTMATDGDKAKAFVDALKSGKSPKEAKSGYGKVVEAQRKMHERISKLESLLNGDGKDG